MRFWPVFALLLLLSRAFAQPRLESAVTFQPQGVVASEYSVVLPQPNGDWFLVATYAKGTVVEKYDRSGRQLAAESIDGFATWQATLDLRTNIVSLLAWSNNNIKVYRLDTNLNQVSARNVPLALASRTLRIGNDGEMFGFNQVRVICYTPFISFKWQVVPIEPLFITDFLFDSARNLLYLKIYDRTSPFNAYIWCVDVKTGERISAVTMTERSESPLQLDSAGNVWLPLNQAVCRYGSRLLSTTIFSGLTGVYSGIGEGDVFVGKTSGGSWICTVGSNPRFVAHNIEGMPSIIVDGRIMFFERQQSGFAYVTAVDLDLTSNLQRRALGVFRNEPRGAAGQNNVVLVGDDYSKRSSWFLGSHLDVIAQRNVAQLGPIDLGDPLIKIARDGRVGTAYNLKEGEAYLSVLDSDGIEFERVQTDAWFLDSINHVGRELIATGRSSGVSYGTWSQWSHGFIDRADFETRVLTDGISQVRYLSSRSQPRISKDFQGLFGVDYQGSIMRGVVNALGYTTLLVEWGDDSYLEVLSPSLQSVHRRFIPGHYLWLYDSPFGLIAVASYSNGNDYYFVYDPVRGAVLQENRLASPEAATIRMCLSQRGALYTAKASMLFGSIARLGRSGVVWVKSLSVGFEPVFVMSDVQDNVYLIAKTIGAHWLQKYSHRGVLEYTVKLPIATVRDARVYGVDRVQIVGVQDGGILTLNYGPR
jgi:hypothetical protein